jgi:hypothetical protein
LELRDQGEDPADHPEIGVGVLMDDLAYDKKMMQNPTIKEIFFNGRHYHITTFITFQYMMGMPPAFRANVDYIFVCKENKRDNIDKLYKYYFGIFDKPADFKKVLYSCTNDFGCLVLDNTSRSNKIEDQVFWYKAKLSRKYRIGSEKMWKIWDSQLKDSDDEEEEEESFSRPAQKSDMVIMKKGPRSICFLSIFAFLFSMYFLAPAPTKQILFTTKKTYIIGIAIFNLSFNSGDVFISSTEHVRFSNT